VSALATVMNIRMTRQQIRAVDRFAVERFHMSGIALMENAGRNAAEIILSTFNNCGRALIACGVGNNGGDGCVIARHLSNAGWRVRLLVVGDPKKASADMLANFKIVEAMRLPIESLADLGRPVEDLIDSLANELLVDALLGTGFQGQVRPPQDAVIHAMNEARRRAVASVDIPSGLDCDTGQPSNATIRADLTITFVAEKVGFSARTAAPFLGRVVVADIGAPRAAIDLARAEPAL
jgi:NAD(P)H-hydrate epimerase